MKRPNRKPARTWSGERLERLRLGYESGEKLMVLAMEHDTLQSTIVRLARTHHWTPRRGRWPGLPILDYIARQGGSVGRAPAAR